MRNRVVKAILLAVVLLGLAGGASVSAHGKPGPKPITQCSSTYWFTVSDTPYAKTAFGTANISPVLSVKRDSYNNAYCGQFRTVATYNNTSTTTCYTYYAGIKVYNTGVTASEGYIGCTYGSGKLTWYSSPASGCYFGFADINNQAEADSAGNYCM